MKKNMIKKVLSALLAAALVLCTLPTAVFAAEPPSDSALSAAIGEEISTESSSSEPILGLTVMGGGIDITRTVGAASPRMTLAQLRAKFPHGKYWNHAGSPGSSNSVNNQNGVTSSPCTKHGVVGTAQQTCNGFAPSGAQLSWQCMGYAEKLGYDATGYNPRVNAYGWTTGTSPSALDSLKPGDIVRYKNNGHSIYVTAVNGDTVTYTDCNSDGHCVIRWGVTISKATLRASFTHVRSAPFAMTDQPETCSCSGSYAGDYICTTSSMNLTIRSGHGSSYGKVGSIPPGAQVRVTKANGTWAHVEYGGVSGYASMQYLARKQTAQARDTRVQLWMSGSIMGGELQSAKTGEWLYLCYKIFDMNTGALFDTYDSSDYTVTLEMYAPNGSLTHSDQADNDNNYIGIRRSEAGVYKGRLKLVFAGGGTTTLEVSIEMKSDPRVTASRSSVELSTAGTKSAAVNFSYSGTSGSIYLSYSVRGSGFTCKWGSWSNSTIPLTITATSGGNGVVTVSLHDAGTKAVLASTVINVVVTSPGYTVSYNANGGSGAPSAQTKTHGNALTLSGTVPERMGYTFLGWSTSSSASSASYKPGASFTANANTTLYAVWQQASVISSGTTSSSFSASVPFAGGYKFYSFTPSASGKYRFESSGSVDAQVYVYSSLGTLIASNDDGGSGRNFLLSGQLTSGNKYYVKVKIFSSGTGTVSFTVRRAYTVSYNANGGSGAPSQQEKLHGASVVIPTTRPTRSGYSFRGWSTSPTASSASYAPGGAYTGNSNVTLYAVWSRNSYAVSYNANGGVGAPTSQEKTDGTELVLSVLQPTREGYTFLGWATSSSAASASYVSGANFANDADTTLYAVWQQNVAITKQPVSASAKSGENISVSVTATGDGLSYQWYTCAPGASKFSKSSITSSTYTTSMSASRDGRRVYCVITDKYGNSVKTDTVTLSMKQTLAITKQPVSTSAAKGANISVSVSAAGEGLSYQWYTCAPGASKFSKSSITTSTYTTSMSASRDGRRVYCVITDKYGSTVKTDTVTLSMKQTLAVTKQPVSTSAAKGANISVSVSATGEGLSYQWYTCAPGASKFSKSSITSSTYTTSMSASRDGRRVYCVITDKYGNTVKTNTVTLSMK